MIHIQTHIKVLYNHYNENNEGAHKNVLNADKLRLQLLLGVLVNAQEA